MISPELFISLDSEADLNDVEDPKLQLVRHYPGECVTMHLRSLSRYNKQHSTVRERFSGGAITLRYVFSSDDGEEPRLKIHQNADLKVDAPIRKLDCIDESDQLATVQGDCVLVVLKNYALREKNPIKRQYKFKCFSTMGAGLIAHTFNLIYNEVVDHREREVIALQEESAYNDIAIEEEDEPEAAVGQVETEVVVQSPPPAVSATPNDYCWPSPPPEHSSDEDDLMSFTQPPDWQIAWR